MCIPLLDWDPVKAYGRLKALQSKFQEWLLGILVPGLFCKESMN